MKTSLPFLQNQLSKTFIGTVLLGLCQFSLAQTTPLETPASVSYPGIIQTFEKLIQIDSTKFNARNSELLKNGLVFKDSTAVTSLDVEPAFLNSVILHSPASYIKLASMDKCRFYDSILTDLLRSSEGKIKNVFVTYVTPDNIRQSSLISRRDFLNKVVNLECPETPKLIAQFQVKNLSEALQKTNFEIPTGAEQCQSIHLSWLKDPKTPYLCQIHEYVREAKTGGGDPADLAQRRTVAKIIEQKLTPIQRDYLENICTHLDDEELFCKEFLNVSFWGKVASGLENKIYAEGICEKVFNTPQVSSAQFTQCLARMKKESDLCLYQSSKGAGLSPQIQCSRLSTALNHSTLRSDYTDCSASSDQLAVTNISRLLLNITKGMIQPFQGPCSVISQGEALAFNRRYDNEEAWRVEACYDDRLREREICTRTYFGQYGNDSESFPNVVADILKETRGAERTLKCNMVSSTEYNPLLLKYKSGCHIIYEANKCFVSECAHRITFNDRTIDFIKTKNRLALDYFPNNVKNERFSQHYLLTQDFKQGGRSLNNLTKIRAYYKAKPKGIIHGVGCAEDILPSFFKTMAMNQCSPLPFIIDGMIMKDDKTVFVTRTALDSLQAPRLISWSNIFSTVRTYQRHHPLRLWSLHGLD